MDRPELIASDVDGTLLTPMERISRRTLDVVRRVREEEVPFVLVTGRPPRWIPPISAPAELTGYAVCANGAALYDIAADRVVSLHGLDPVLLHDVADELRTVLPKAHLGVERVGASAHDHQIPQFVVESDFHNPWGGGESLAVPRAELLGHTAVKMLVSDQRMTSDEMAQAARAVLSDAVAVTYSTNSGLIEISARAVNKATGLAEVGELLGIAPERMIAFGDMPNDVEMLIWAGHGVAMANAHPAVLDVADEITAPNSEDGVAQVLERWF